MWLTIPIALYGWLFVIIWLFSSKTPQMAVIIAVMGAFLFLPMSSIDYSIPLLPSLNKGNAIAYGILLGEMISGAKAKHQLKMGGFDVPMLLWCFIVPFATSLSNGLGLYDGLNTLVDNYFSWGVIFWAGRRYFGSPSSIRSLSLAMLTGALICVPMVFWEVRMSPNLHLKVYGFFQHSFLQHFRQGGFRPILFMQHGLMVALWMSVNSVIAFWLWQTKGLDKVWKVSSGIAFCLLAISTVLCKSSGALVFMILGIGCFFIYKRKYSSAFLKWFIIFVPFYFYFRLYNIVTIPQIEAFMAKYFSEERVASLMIRILQEDLFGKNAMLRPLFGWGWLSRAWPVNLLTGEQLVPMVDSYWIIAICTSGLLGLLSVYASLGIGPLCILASSGKPKNWDTRKKNPYATDAVVLSIAVTFFMLDSLLNAMITPIYILCSGALISYYTNGDKEETNQLL